MVKSEILKYFFLYEVIIFKWNTCVISCDPQFIKMASNVFWKPAERTRRKMNDIDNFEN